MRGSVLIGVEMGAAPELSLENLIVYEDGDSRRDGALNMALDELLLERADRPWLRWYGWDRPTISVGYFTPPDAVGASEGHWVRRWTGGGLVRHGGAGDRTFALGIPRSLDASRWRAGRSYRWIHGALVETLAMLGVDCRLSHVGDTAGGASCFDSPVAADVVTPQGAKLAGGAQRRARSGLLHQGSIQTAPVADEIELEFARRLASRVERQPLPAGALEEAEALAEAKYRSAEWRSGLRRG